MKFVYVTAVSLSLFLLPILLEAQAQAIQVKSEKKSTIFQRMQEEELDQIIIFTDFTTLTGERNVPHELDGTIQMKNEKGTLETVPIKVELRGKTRRNMCEMPPLRIKFPKDELKDRGLSKKGNKLKLVTHCNDGLNKDLLLKEYWAYRLYNQLSPASFKPHLVKVRYVNTAKPGKNAEEYLGYFLESHEELARRLDAEQVELWGLNPDQVDKQMYYYTLLFQYMISNDDWDLSGSRNLKLIQPKDGAPPVVIPYDFDYSGLVDAPYAKPSAGWGRVSVTERIAMGQFDSREDLQAVINEFLALKDEELKCYRECTILSDRSKKNMDRFLGMFFKELENTKRIQRVFLGNGR